MSRGRRSLDIIGAPCVSPSSYTVALKTGPARSRSTVMLMAHTRPNSSRATPVTTCCLLLPRPQQSDRNGSSVLTIGAETGKDQVLYVIGGPLRSGASSVQAAAGAPPVQHRQSRSARGRSQPIAALHHPPQRVISV